MTEETWQLLSGKLRNFFRKRVADETLADDWLQESFLRIHGGVHTLKDHERTSA